MANRIPGSAVLLMTTVYWRIFPAVKEELSYWRKRAEQIPNDELRMQAIASMESKRFHCQGGAVYALLAGEKWKEALRFIVAYQTISDYLDNLCDRSTSMDPADFRLLHKSMEDALTPGNESENYYGLREDQDDGSYLAELVQTCQQIVNNMDGYSACKKQLLYLEGLYADLQVHKHVKQSERVSRLTDWHLKNNTGELNWYEFSAAAGSTLGVFCLISYALGGGMTDSLPDKILSGYFPYIQGLHILLDYYIDQREDREEADLNFCSFYPNPQTMKDRFVSFIEHAKKNIQVLPDKSFHEMVVKGLVGLYLGDPKVRQLPDGKKMKEDLLKASGNSAKFFHWNTRMYYKMKAGRA